MMLASDEIQSNLCIGSCGHVEANSWVRFVQKTVRRSRAHMEGRTRWCFELNVWRLFSILRGERIPDPEVATSFLGVICKAKRSPPIIEVIQRVPS